MSNTKTGSHLVWILKGPNAGDYGQLQVLARALGIPYVTKQLVFRSWELLLHASSRPTLAGLERAASDRLDAPWPDLVLTAGRRNELVAHWIRHASGGKSRLVHVGRPWTNPARFDLVVSNRQYFLEASNGIIVNDLPLTDLTSASLAADRTTWEPRWRDLPRPWTVLLVGGDSGPLVFTPRHARALARQIDARIARSGGSVLVTTSGRTPPRSADALLSTLRSKRFVHRWPSPDENPYRGLLACGDEFIVTGDSMSMLAEACATGRPVHLFDYSDDTRGWLTSSAYRWKPLVHRLASSIGPLRMRRDIRRIHAVLMDEGRVRRLDASDDEAHSTCPRRPDELARTTARVRALLN